MGQSSILTSQPVPRGYVYDGRLVFSTADVVNILPGLVRDSANGVDIPFGALQVDMTASGAGGLDTGARAGQTVYAIYVIMNPATFAVAAIASLSFVAPALPAGFTVFRRLGGISLNTVLGIRPFFMSGLGTVRTLWWNLTQGPIGDTSCRVLNAGNATVSTVIAAANRFFFPTSPEVWAQVTFVSATPGTAMVLGPTGVTAILGQVSMISQVAGIAAQRSGIVANVAVGGTLSYSVPNAADQANVWVQGCTDQLAA